MSIFDPENFLEATLGGANSTARKVLPVGVYPAFVSDLKFKNGISEKNNQPWARLDVHWMVSGPDVKSALNRDEITIVQGIMLDLDDSGNIDMSDGRNVRLGRLRKALGLNDGPIQFRAFLGRQAKLQIEHRMYEGAPQEDIKSVASA